MFSYDRKFLHVCSVRFLSAKFCNLWTLFLSPCSSSYIIINELTVGAAWNQLPLKCISLAWWYFLDETTSKKLWYSMVWPMYSPSKTRVQQLSDSPTHTCNLKWGPSCCAKTNHIFHFQPPSPCLWVLPHFATTLTLYTLCIQLPPAPLPHSDHILSCLPYFCGTKTILWHLLNCTPLKLPTLFQFVFAQFLFHHFVYFPSLISTYSSSLYDSSFSFHSFSSLAALGFSCRHSKQKQHTSPHQGYTIGTLVCMCVCLEQSLQWGHIRCNWPIAIYCRLQYIFPSQSTHVLQLSLCWRAPWFC